jgi:putative oxidoreductase
MQATSGWNRKLEMRRYEGLMKYITLAARLLIGSLFVYASIHKIIDPLDFSASIRNYTIVPPSWSNILALTLPWIEIGAGGFLIFGIQTRPSALLTTGMLGVFLIAVTYAYSIGLDIDCGCFSSAASSTGRVGLYHLVRDSSLFLISLFILIADKGDFSISGFPLLDPLRPAGA